MTHETQPQASTRDEAPANDTDDDHLADCVFDDGDEEDDLAELSCGEMSDGGCSLAGTEYCDWKCPFSDSMSVRARKEGAA